MTIITNHEVRSAERTLNGKKKLIAVNSENQKEVEIVGDEILVASGREPNTDLLHPERSGIKTDERGYILSLMSMQRPRSQIFGL